ncbi:hypothetical protein [Brevundimonas sp. BAL3]|jgi:hypothetical protein|uniref:hypothetical protein n=1 Tax=Brevundimonas sp. BAL3 TaxID=391600 RepID=UPI0003123EC7|nr:hypothetical protein [Brevundimonas sp. BAL3]TAJ54068.1 MAG: hypothetical protein EPO54_01400 [Brevundimonas sp.]
MIVVYNQQGRIAYTVDDPYPPELLEVYADRAEAETEFNFHDEAPAPIDDCYIDVAQAAMIPRPDMPVTLDGLTLSDVPVGAAISVDGGAMVFEATAGTVEIEAEDAGSYVVRLQMWPYRDFVAVVEAAS